MTLFDPARIAAAAHINRWRGWTTRPYSILEHMLIGTVVARLTHQPDHVQLKFLVHDMHETEVIGDVPSPDKRAYVNEAFHAACNEFDLALGQSLGLEGYWWRDDELKRIDYQMLLVENDTIVTRRDPNLPVPDYNSKGGLLAIRQTLLAPARTPGQVVVRWNAEFKRLVG